MYITKVGDQWDMIALNVYGDEKYADVLMQANPKHLDIYQFPSGVEIVTPELTSEQTSTLPPWR